MAGFQFIHSTIGLVLLGGLEPPLLAPEANALSTELQEREADFTINDEVGALSTVQKVPLAMHRATHPPGFFFLHLKMLY
jgi:hypothetical protein